MTPIYLYIKDNDMRMSELLWGYENHCTEIEMERGTDSEEARTIAIYMRRDIVTAIYCGVGTYGRNIEYLLRDFCDYIKIEYDIAWFTSFNVLPMPTRLKERTQSNN